MTTRQSAVTTGRVTTEGDDIYYEVRGQGPPLLLISGGGGDAGFFSLVAPILSDEYKVITYDRRGNSRSTRHAPQNFTMPQQSRDAVAVLHAAGETSAFVCGNSGGAVIALDMAATQPAAVRTAVVHEAPVTAVHPAGEKWRRFFAGVYWLGFRVPASVAMLWFSLPLGIPRRGFSRVPEDFAQRMSKNHDFFIKHELLAFSNYQPDLRRIKQNGVRVVMAAGQMTLAKKKFYGQTAPILARLLDCECVTFPGHHLSYFDLAEEWAATLRGILHASADVRAA
jgi:pimeloyl-ACP methyl ester carboxylesterase